VKTSKPFFLTCCIAVCRYLSLVAAAVHYGLLSAGLMKVPLYIAHSGQNAFKNLRNIWHTRLVRRVISVSVRSPLRTSTLRLVNSNVPLPPGTGCVIAICHTPWKRLLVQWCLENNIGLVVGNGNWSHRKGRIQKKGRGFSDLRDIVNHLRHNGRIVIAFDCFSICPNQCRLKFLGNYHNMSTLPARLAAIAGVPLITAIPRLRNGMIHIDSGPRFGVNKPDSDPGDVMQRLVSFLESEIRTDPGIWPGAYYKWLQRSQL